MERRGAATRHADCVDNMKRIVLECKGRLANQILCWSNARHVIKEMGLKDRLIVINHDIPEHCVSFPGAIAAQVDASNIPRVMRGELESQTGDCLWIWEDVYADFPTGNAIKKIIQSIYLEPSFEKQIENTATNLIGIHARFGDYVSVDPKNPPKTMPPFVRGSEEYFLTAMELCRHSLSDPKFFLASDGTSQELEFITKQPNVIRGWDIPLFDLFALSKCRLIIGSASTFSTVASYYGDVPLTVPTMSAKEIKEVISTA